MQAPHPAIKPLRIAVVANTSWYLYNFRRNLMRALAEEGHDVIAIGGEGEYAMRLQQEGFRHAALAFSSDGTRPLRELKTVFGLRSALLRERIDLVLSFTPKGNIYAALAMLGSDMRQIMNISGLGRAFVQPGPLGRLVTILYRLTVGRAAWVFFQNDDDWRFFIDSGLVRRELSSRLPGSGVDLQHFCWAPLPAHDDSSCTFLMVARLLWEKGVGEYVAAARLVRQSKPQTRMQILGPLDESPRRGVPRTTLQAWVDEGSVEYLGQTDEVRTFLHAADCVVLPSYREGVPRSLLEAAAMGRPVITSDTVGCRQAVDEGATGLLCQPRDAGDLAGRMLQMIELGPQGRQQLGLAGRAKMEREFDERAVIDAYRAQIAAARQG
jgi:glycosyltransferase involved in cell wall biosynthesis